MATQSSSTPFIKLHQIAFGYSPDALIINDFSFIFTPAKYAIVGDNGCGKSTLLQLIQETLSPSQGSVHTAAKVAYCPQTLTAYRSLTFAQLLGYDAKLHALKRITEGSLDPQNYQIIGDDWQVESAFQQQRQGFDLDHIEPDQPLATLSGGELTRAVLCQLWHTSVDFLLLDEPTNNLDAMARQQLCQRITEWPRGLIIISHDRQLLQHVDHILEVTPQEIYHYGGNYHVYQAEKNRRQQALQQQWNSAKQALSQTQRQLQINRERLQQRARQGKQARRNGSLSKLEANALKDRSGRTQGTQKRRGERQQQAAQQALDTLKQRVISAETLAIQLPDPQLPTHKRIVTIDNISFQYPQQPSPILENFSWELIGPQRFAIKGRNGCGKSTLAKLILRQWVPQQGRIELALDPQRISYVDQHASRLQTHASVLENFQRLNPDYSDQECYQHLAHFLFRNQHVHTPVTQLSGGEKVRALLACCLMASQPPQLLIIDEPTNHLDITSITQVEKALAAYRGALLVISHDDTFLANIGIERVLELTP